jgi:hypothetical protein
MDIKIEQKFFLVCHHPKRLTGEALGEYFCVGESGECGGSCGHSFDVPADDGKTGIVTKFSVVRPFNYCFTKMFLSNF